MLNGKGSCNTSGAGGCPEEQPLGHLLIPDWRRSPLKSEGLAPSLHEVVPAPQTFPLHFFLQNTDEMPLPALHATSRARGWPHELAPHSPVSGQKKKIKHLKKSLGYVSWHKIAKLPSSLMLWNICSWQPEGATRTTTVTAHFFL